MLSGNTLIEAKHWRNQQHMTWIFWGEEELSI
jgi:hypothetical protein